MVARGETPTDPAAPSGGDPGRGPWLAWRRLLTRVASTSTRSPDTSGTGRTRERPGRLVWAYVLDPEGTTASHAPEHPRTLTVLGVIGLSVGSAASIALPFALGAVPLGGLLNAVWLAVWAAVRLLVMRVASPDRTTRAQVGRAALPALLPFAIAVTAPLDVVATLLSWRMTYLGLRGRGVGSQDALTVTSWAFGGQLAVAAGAWIARGALFVPLARL